MHFNQLLTLAALLATVAVSQATVVLPRGFHDQFLNARQVSDPCQVPCATFFADCPGVAVACVCTPAYRDEMQTCITCELSNFPTVAVVTSTHDMVDAYQSLCAGYGLKPITFPGGLKASATT